MLEYKICTNCVMDTTDSAITFGENGVCDHCRDFEQNVKPNWHTDERGRTQLAAIIDKVRTTGKGQEFDCILGLSGGLDSSYMLHLLVKEFDLRPLVFHVDGGWNSDLAVNNIQMLVEKLGLDLFTEVIDWEDMRDFQLAFFKSGISQIDIPQDHAFVATLYKFANKYGVKHIMNGGNISTECVRNPLEWLYYGTDMWLINDIRKQFCTRPLTSYPFSSVLFHKFYLRYLKRVQVVRPLNYMPYSKEMAINTLCDEYGWRAYPQKHFESRFTKFFEGYWMPTRFGYDTRKVQFSSLILTGQMTREEALEKLKVPAFDPETIDDEFAYIAKKLGISVEELRHYHTMPLKTYKDYRNQESLFNMGAKVLRAVGIERSIKR
ncbi:N-acetyl sugar amidotransferase [Marivivens donghaensis]|uniref:N-acetyl sugar amidotransferase n=1 Tax=Marivivens donghaensis TaxID=1699413 RepID=UPI003F6A4C05